MELIFLSPALFAGLSALAIPILLHLRPRQRRQLVQFAAMRFLQPALRRTSRRLRLQNLLLLLLRLAIFTLFVLALTRPIMRQRAAPGQKAEGPTDTLIVIDSSMSMGYKDGPISRFDRAKRVGQELVEASDKEASTSFIRMGRSPDVRFGEFTRDQEAVGREIQASRLTSYAANVGETLAACATVLESAEGASSDICLLTDLQRFGWPAAGTLPALEQLKDVNLYVVDMAHEGSRNLSVTAITSPADVTEIGAHITVVAEVRNLSEEAQPALVRMAMDGKLCGEESMAVEGNGTAEVAFTHAFDRSGPHTGYVALGGDPLAVDDKRFFAITVHDGLPVLCVNGEHSDIPFLNETFFLATALCPEGDAGTATSPFRPRVVRPAEITTLDLGAYRFVALANVASLEANQVLALEKYVDHGGKLLVFLGDQVDPKWYNEALLRKGASAGLLPAELAGTQGSEKDRNQFLTLADPDLSHPIFLKFRDRSFGDLSTPRFFKIFKTSPDESARVLLKFNDEQPALIAGSRGTGEMLLFVSTADGAWTDFPTKTVYLPLVHSIADYLSGRAQAKREYLVGEPAVFSLDLSEQRTQATITDPLGTGHRLRVSLTSGRGLLAFHDTRMPGLYQVLFEGQQEGRDDAFAVNVDPRESDLSRLTEDELREALPGVNVTLVREAEAAAEIIKKRRDGFKLSLPLLYLAFALYFIEAMLSGKFAASSEDEMVPRPVQAAAAE